VALAIAVLLAAAAASCSAPSSTEPSIGTVNLAPKLVIDITDGGLRFRTGPREDPAVRIDPPTVGSGTVVEIANTTNRDHRLQGNDGTVFDTGLLRPGEKTTVVFTNATSTDLTVTITDPLDAATNATIVVRPKPTAG
jgi:hypothetical protein